jgi:hypothetical protein
LSKDDLNLKGYAPQPVRRMFIPKAVAGIPFLSSRRRRGDRRKRHDLGQQFLEVFAAAERIEIVLVLKRDAVVSLRHRRHRPASGRRAIAAELRWPISATAAPLLEACLLANVHYLDITGEIDVIEAAAALNERAKQAGIVLIPAVGFDVVPSDTPPRLWL